MMRWLAQLLCVLAAYGMVVPAQAYPDKPVRLIVPFTAGGGTDAMARILAEGLGQKLGQRFIIENVTGGGGNPGADRVSRAEANGYTLLVATMGILTVNPWIYASIGTSIVDRLVPVSILFDTGHVVVVNPSVKASTLRDLAALTQNAERPLTFASGGVGSSTHLYGELFKLAVNVPMLHVPYRGNGPALTDVVAGHVQVMFDQIASASEHAKSGSVRALAVTTKERLSFLPDVPTAAEAGYPQLMGTSWIALMAPKGTPPDIIAAIGRALSEVAKDGETREKIATLGGTLVITSPQEAGDLIARELARWEPVVKAAGLREN